MRLKVLFVFLSAILFACGKPNVSHNMLPAIAAGTSSTAIYLSDGSGIDLFKLPIIDTSSKDSSGRAFKSLYYDYPVKKYYEIDKAIDESLTGQGYLKIEDTVPEHVINKLLYVKPGFNTVVVQYEEIFKEGFQHNIRVLFWWHE
ncbi:hypothetical protein [Thiopseudomonas alkaliphila]|uniref:hypothetical protein n=1 Tax=Thiopseudomonas alkaliphila TaxID=1697053 RepID=UPI00069E7FF3|nr:hypothetical protein [Thiopseudomonas alkaliphila]AKX57045.1 hypothetical protein AKN89_03800 [Thiopseudomonas alkaliphila]